MCKNINYRTAAAAAAAERLRDLISNCSENSVTEKKIDGSSNPLSFDSVFKRLSV
jgi:hypothetical protein